MKTCTKCSRRKSLDEFSKDCTKQDGLTSACKKCHADYIKNRILTKTQKDARQIYHRRHALKQYGLTIEQYDAMYAEQGGVCAICEEPQFERFRLAVDHDHTTGQVRKLLCNRCNQVLGAVNDNVQLLIRLQEYLQEAKVVN
jgi:hypothetical protein